MGLNTQEKWEPNLSKYYHKANYYKSEILFVNQYACRFSDEFPNETGIWTSSLEYYYKELGEEIMNACLDATIEKKMRHVPNQERRSRYLYSLLRSQVRGKYNDPRVFKIERKNK